MKSDRFEAPALRCIRVFCPVHRRAEHRELAGAARGVGAAAAHGTGEIDPDHGFRPAIAAAVSSAISIICVKELRRCSAVRSAEWS